MNISDIVITSRQNATVVKYASLNQKKYRDEYNLALCPGIKLSAEAIKAGVETETVLVSENRMNQTRAVLEEAELSSGRSGVSVTLVSDDVLAKVTGEKSPDGVCAIIKPIDNLRKNATIFNTTPEKCGSIMILSQIRDPGNLGTIIRSALSFSCDELLISSDCADIYNPKTMRAAMGSLFYQKITVSDDLKSDTEALRRAGRRVFAAELREGAIPLDGLDITGSDVFIIGNEGHGIPEELSRAADKSVYIPISEHAESLNAAIAASVILYKMRG